MEKSKKCLKFNLVIEQILILYAYMLTFKIILLLLFITFLINCIKEKKYKLRLG